VACTLHLIFLGRHSKEIELAIHRWNVSIKRSLGMPHDNIKDMLVKI